ncbi:MAG: hypothetical protein J5693_01210 [Bacteroidales bacterium]|nr:hypothetical protein [Bacteroidales bacterium]
MKIKHLLVAAAAVLLSGATIFAQTPEEIVQKMNAEMRRGDAEGFAMDFNIKMPIVGTIRSHNLVLGDKMRTDISGKDKSSVCWSDATTKWTYENQTGELIIENKTPSDSDNTDTKAFDNIVDGYKLTLKKETEDAWFILCKKLKSNKNKDDSKRMELTVAKATYLPICLRAKSSLFTFSIENYEIGVSEESVTFDPAAYPDAKITDKR